MNKIAAMVAVVFAGLVAACGTKPPTNGDPCALTPDAPECTCDDGNACTSDTRRDSACAHGAVEYGSPCIGEEGFCDSDGTCRKSCETLPCFDWSIEPSYGCVYTMRKNGWTCTDGNTNGICRNGACEPPITGADPA